MNNVGIANILLVGDVDASLAQLVSDSFNHLVRTNTNMAFRQYTVKFPNGLDGNVNLFNDNEIESQNAMSWFYQIHYENK